MRNTRARGYFAAAAVLFLGTAAPVFSQFEDDPALNGMSRQMRFAIRLYDRGDDVQAMDKFMEVLTQGDPAERSMANEYINLITHRMNTGERGLARPTSLRRNETVVEAADPDKEPARAPRPQAAPEVVVEREGVADAPAALAAAPRPERPTVAPPPAPPKRYYAEEAAPQPEANKALMKKEIRAKLRNALETSLRELRGHEDIRLLMLENGDPQALAVPSPKLFQSGIAFHKDATPVLDALTRLVFSLGSAQVVILPEGTAIGDAKVLDMRRTMGLSSHFYQAGVAPPRVRVNLLNTQVEIPKPLRDFRGIVILFQYNQPLPLTVDSAFGEEAGPPISLGVFPATLRPDRGEGAVIELSVQDPPAGLVSWKFQLLRPSSADGRDLAPLQEVVGGSPVFHQIFWNGRQNYFGAPLPSGRYECVLTATDGRNRQRTLHRWIQLQGASSVPERQLGPLEAAGAPSADLPQAPPPKSSELIKEGAGKPQAMQVAERKSVPKRKAGRSAAKKKKQEAKKEAPDKQTAEPAADSTEGSPVERTATDAQAVGGGAPAAPAAPVAASKPQPGGYKLDFNPGSHQLTPEGEKRLARIAETMAYYPLESLRVTGYAVPSEAQAEQLAQRRAQMVAGLLINKYQIEPKKIRVSSAVAPSQGPRVQADFVKGD